MNLIVEARKSLSRFCKNKHTLCVPAQPSDDDLVVAKAIDVLELAIKSLERIANDHSPPWDPMDAKRIARETLASIT